MVQQLLELHFPGYKKAPPVVKPGFAQVGTGRVNLTSVLFDSGALHANYISEDLAENYFILLADRIREVGN